MKQKELNSMIWKFSFLILLSCGAASAYSQETLPPAEQYNWNVNFEYSKGALDGGHGHQDYLIFDQYSLNFERRVSKHIGLNWNLDWMIRSDGQQQIHFPAGPLVGGFIALAILASTEDIDALWLFLLALIPDGMSVYIPLNQNWEISPYANVLGLDVITNPEWEENKLEFNISFGTKLSYYSINRIRSFVFLEARKTTHIPWNYAAGVGVGFLFGKGS